MLKLASLRIVNIQPQGFGWFVIHNLKTLSVRIDKRFAYLITFQNLIFGKSLLNLGFGNKMNDELGKKIAAKTQEFALGLFSIKIAVITAKEAYNLMEGRAVRK